MEIEVTSDCQACGACEKLCPGAFELVDGKSRPLSPVEAEADEVLDTADRCPGGAIQVEPGNDSGTEPELEEVLREAKAAGIAGADYWLGELEDGPVMRAEADVTDAPAEPEPDTSPQESASRKKRARGLLVQISIVAVIVLVSGYLAMG